jgi:transcriptional antiterminator RfaH
MRTPSDHLSLDDGTLRWYVVFAQPHREAIAAAHLKNQGFRTFLPLCMKTVRHARQFRTRAAAFFPRYLFVELAIGRDRWRSVNGTVGVASLVMEGERPRPVRPGVVELLMAATDASGIIPIGPGLRPGDSVRIVTGPFAGIVGELAAIDGAGRVKVLLELMGAVVPVSAALGGVVSAA